MAEPNITGSSGGEQGSTPVSSSFKFNVPGLSQTTGEIRALNTAVLDLRNTMKEIGSQQGMLMQGFNSMVGQMQAGANSTASALNGAGGRGGGGGGSTPTGIPFNFSSSPSTAFDTMTKSLAVDSNIAAMVANVLQAPAKYAFNRFEEARANAPGIAAGLGPVATMNGTTIVDLIQRLQEGTPVKGDISNVLSSLNQGAMLGYGDLNSRAGGSYFEGIRQMQAFTPGVGSSQLSSMQNQWLSSTGTHQRALILSGGAMSGFGAGGIPKTLQEWAESTLKWFEGQRPGKDRGKKFTKEELATQQFPGSNMDAWFTATGVPEYMREYFWMYVIGKAQSGSSDIAGIVGFRGDDLAMDRLRTQTAQGRREYQMLGSKANYENFSNREGADRRFTEILGQVDKGLGAMLGGLLGPALGMIPTPVANLAATSLFSMTSNVASSATSYFLGGGGRGMGDPGWGGGRKKRTYIGDTYGGYGGTTTAHMDPSFAGRVEAMMAANPRLQITSGFRDGALQGRLHANGVGMVAPAGQSMHGRGLAADLGPESEFGWIVSNAHRFGLESGINHDEPWHVGMPGTVPIGDALSFIPGYDEAKGWIEDRVDDGRRLWNTSKAIAASQPVAAGFLNDPVGTIAGGFGSAASSIGGAVVNNIPGMGTLVSLAETLIDAFQGIKSVLSGDLSALFGGGGLFSLDNIMDKGLQGISAVTGLPLDQIANGKFTDAIAGWLTGGSGIRKSPVQSSVNWNEARPSKLGQAGGFAGGGGSANVASILQKYGSGGSVAPASVAGKESAILTALQAAAAAGFTGDELIAITAIAGRESGWNPRAFNGNTRTGDQSYGLYQINMLGSLGPARRRSFGISRNEELFDPNVSGRAAWITSSNGTNFSPWGAYKGKANLYNAEKYVEPVYNIAKQAGFVGDPRRRAAVGDATTFARYSPQVTAPTMMTMNAPRTASVVSSPVTMENTFHIQVANDADARRVAFVVADHLGSLLSENEYMVS